MVAVDFRVPVIVTHTTDSGVFQEEKLPFRSMNQCHGVTLVCRSISDGAQSQSSIHG